MSLPIFVDIDGTLTDNPNGNGKENIRAMNTVRQWIRDGKEVVIWSANGTKYAQDFCRRNSMLPLAAIGKPMKVYDDNPEIRPGGLAILDAKELE